MYSETEHARDVRFCAFCDFELREGEEEKVSEGCAEICTIDVLVSGALGVVDIFTSRAVQLDGILICGIRSTDREGGLT